MSLALLCGAGAMAPQPSASRPVLLAQDDTQQSEGADQPEESSGMVVRMGRLENQIRTLTGQVEQLQFENKRLENDLRKMQGDVDFRLQDLERSGSGGASRPAVALKRGEADAAGGPPAAEPLPNAGSPAADIPSGGSPPARPKQSRAATGDAFDPDANPNAPGAPRPLGTTAPSPPIGSRPQKAAGGDQHAPLDLMQRAPAIDAGEAGAQPSVIPAPAMVPRDPNAVASLVPGGTRDEYESDLSLYRQGQYDGAASAFQAFATKYPRDRLASDAAYLAGDSYSRLGRHREAAEQFLRVSTDFSKSARAPDALLRLGVSLNSLGAKDQACATYLEVNRRYPAASSEVRAGVERELKRARCPGNG